MLLTKCKGLYIMSDSIFPEITSKSTSFYLSTDAIAFLSTMAEIERRSNSSQVEYLIRKHYEDNNYASKKEVKDGKD